MIGVKRKATPSPLAGPDRDEAFLERRLIERKGLRCETLGMVAEFGLRLESRQRGLRLLLGRIDAEQALVVLARRKLTIERNDKNVSHGSRSGYAPLSSGSRMDFGSRKCRSPYFCSFLYSPPPSFQFPGPY